MKPPKFGQWLLESFCSYDFLPTALWDLEELFYQNLKTKGPLKAKLLYLIEVLSIVVHLFFKGKSQFSINKIAMFKHNILISYRSFMRFKSTFLINLIGLASGLACTLFIYLWVTDELNIDKFHEHGDRLYQVLNHDRWGGQVKTKTYTPRLLAQSFQEDFPEVEMAISVNEDWADQPGYISFNEVTFTAEDNHIDKDFFKVFSYELLIGNIDNPLPNTKSVLLSNKLAQKLFDSPEDAVGQTIEWHQEEMSGLYSVSGIFEAPKHSSKDFEMLFPMGLLEEHHENYNLWANNNDATYLVMRDGADINAFNAKIENFLKTKNDWAKNTLSLQLFQDRYLNGVFTDAQQTGGRASYVLLFSLIGVFVLAIACINFMNLTTAKAGNRLKEIGVKKTIGAKKKTLAAQYLSESMLMAFMALVVAIAIVLGLLPFFNVLTGKNLSLDFTLELASALVAITLIVGILSGSYPALYLSSINPISMLKSRQHKTFGDAFIRKSLVIFQFSITIIFISAVMVISAQIDFIHSKNLGYDKENVVYFGNTGIAEESYDVFIDRISNLPGVIHAASADHDLTGNHGGTSYLSWPGKEKNNYVSFANLEMGFGFIETMGIELVSGRTYDNKRAGEDNKIIFNETAIEAMGIKDPIGKTIQLWGKDREIIGVVKDFHTDSFYNDIMPTFILSNGDLGKTLVKLRADAIIGTMAIVKGIFEEYNTEIPFEYRFIDSDFERMYVAEQRVSTLAKSFSIVAVIISCLGLLGLTVFTAEKRSKEIGIRKALGSGTWRIIKLLSADFTKMVMLAMIIGLPVSYFAAQRWTADFSYSIELKWWYFGLAGLTTLIIAWLTVSFQTVKAANTNPVDTLRAE
ncbi:FtsX-like permease family protein [Roseivirga sp.]|uniref:FtsX-like permease family protein n=1 Tax=Roseivirga sp. TaxID=1964215 RepID=UPI003B8CE7B3